MTGFGAAMLGVLMIAAFLLAGGGLHLILHRKDKRKGALMLIAAAVMIGNVLVWSL
ncbi:hypothetical protein [Sphingosinicella terrae]|uniref:hypothetical protein n=1 Tax=Sphingosinicella terrae TaxID=2172047 RepID=UPI002548F3D0|nr:hypothetical protein [Sphingosinicella terrae]